MDDDGSVDLHAALPSPYAYELQPRTAPRQSSRRRTNRSARGSASGEVMLARGDGGGALALGDASLAVHKWGPPIRPRSRGRRPPARRTAMLSVAIDAAATSSPAYEDLVVGERMRRERGEIQMNWERDK
ncbi:hypothetical protein PR202_gb23485 [Eleusine coracana subsp. coracana]|uniref:Uncharacterized protein n=1 Tax=Eleusine coracana subsp. coracana TaxID=191504 RepID=A0AAV5FJ31_ELECO|nr:hypothetical protein PR202_gb23485 [Eleusine coracana subsp. coracana]